MSDEMPHFFTAWKEQESAQEAATRDAMAASQSWLDAEAAYLKKHPNERKNRQAWFNAEAQWWELMQNPSRDDQENI